MLKTTQTPSTASGRIHLSVEIRIWDGSLLASRSTREGEDLLCFARGEKSDLHELAELIGRRNNYQIEGWTDLGDEAWHDLVNDGDEIEVGFNSGFGLYIAGAAHLVESIALRLRVQLETAVKHEF